MWIHSISWIKQSNFPWHFFKILKLLVADRQLYQVGVFKLDYILRRRTCYVKPMIFSLLSNLQKYIALIS